MPTGSSLKYMMNEFPDRAIDVGIAEQHAVTLAAGIALNGFTVFCAIYSTFLQRAYDQLIHDVALQNIPVIFCIDRAGLVGEDGATHQGVFDIAYLKAIPNMQILAPKDAVELRNTLFTLQKFNKQPVAVRYPRGYSSIEEWNLPFEMINFSKIQLIKRNYCCNTINRNHFRNCFTGCSAKQLFSVYHFVQIKPLCVNEIANLIKNYNTVITVERRCCKWWIW